MKNYTGIDLGTTNSAICSYDGERTRIWKSPEQNDVTPSAIYVDKRGNRYVGKRAYDSAPHSPGNAATLFKRSMGSSTPIELPAVGIKMTPEECSAEILKILFGYLPEEFRDDPSIGSVITVPAAFNQMQKDATMRAAEMANIGQVALMQEPVAAVMSIMRAHGADGIFVVYDLGGGTLDVAIAENIGGRVELHANGGIQMCGGRDFDRGLVDSVIKPWLFDKFELPENLFGDPEYKRLLRLAAWAGERAKIQLSADEQTVISLSEIETRVQDQAGQEIYLDISITRNMLDELIDEKLRETIDATRETLTEVGISPHDCERMVFIGGPTNYKPLRDKVSFELGIAASAEVNPMTAVAEGAALFAESIEWSSQSRGRKSKRGQLGSSGPLDLTFNYTARTPDAQARILVQTGDRESKAEFQIDSLDTGWTSGRVSIKDGMSMDVPLAKNGENTFQVFAFDATGRSVALEQDKIVVTRIAATVDAIPASHSISIAALEKLGGTQTATWLIRAGDQLPKKGECIFKAAESLKAGSTGSLSFQLFEGENENPIDNRPIGSLLIRGSDFDEGVIPVGGDLHCEFEMQDSGRIVLEVSVPSIGGTFGSGRNFYSPQEGQIDFSSASIRVSEEGEQTLQRLQEIHDVVDDPRLEQAKAKLVAASQLDPDEPDMERTQEAKEEVFKALSLITKVRKENLKEIRETELNRIVGHFDEHLRQLARPSEEKSFDNLTRTAQRVIDRDNRDFESHMDELRRIIFEVLWRQDGFVVRQFKEMASAPHRFSDSARFEELVQVGTEHMQSDDIDALRQVVAHLSQIRIDLGSSTDMFTNIVRM